MSSVQCPQCQADLEHDFGVITCPSCAAVVMIDIEGRVSLAAENSAGAISSEVNTFSEEPLSFAEEENQVNEASPIPEAEVSLREELQDFANSETLTGPLTYTVILDGVDSGQLRQDLKEILTDSRFKLDVSGVMALIQNGHLEIENLNPVKAALLVQRLRETPLTVSWRQHVFS